MKYLLAMAGVLLFCCSCRQEQGPEKPNVIIFYVDDLGWSGLGCYGCDCIDTPNIDNLAAKGVRFTSAYSAAPNCSPSRASLLTGLYPPKHGITQFLPGNLDFPRFRNSVLVQPELPEGLDPQLTTIAEVFSSAGYATASIGKWHLGDQRFGPKKNGFEKNIGGNEKDHLDRIFPPYFDDYPFDDTKPKEHITDYLLRQTLGFIDANKKEPFFLYIPFFSIHYPLGGNLELQRKYAKLFGLRPGGSKEHMIRASYAAMTEGVDQFVGVICNKMKELNLDEKTIFVLTSDNGAGHDIGTRGLRGKKGFIYEGGIRVPLIFAGAGIQGGGVCDVPINQIDLMPTLINMAGLQAPPTDGVNLQPLFEGSGTIAERDLFWHYPHYANFGGMPGSAIRSGDYKLIHFYESDAWELYNLKSDLIEQNNLVETEPMRYRAMRKRLEAWLQESGAKIPQPRR